MPLAVVLFLFPGGAALALALAALAGLCFFFRGIVLLCNRPVISTASFSALGVKSLESAETGAEAAQVIRLSPLVSAPESSIHMTSQERIAAALQRAGVVTPSAWTMSESSAAAQVSARETDVHSAPKSFEVHEPLAWKIGLMVCGGPALTLTCLYLLATQFGWL